MAPDMFRYHIVCVSVCLSVCVAECVVHANNTSDRYQYMCLVNTPENFHYVLETM